MDFRNWILESFTPVVMVVASAEAEALVAEQNGLTIVDMLRPYGYFHHLSGMRSKNTNSIICCRKKAAPFPTLPRCAEADMQSLCALLESNPIALRSSSFASSVAKTCMLQEMRLALVMHATCTQQAAHLVLWS